MVMRNAKGKYSQEDIEFIGPNNNEFTDLLTEENELDKELAEAIALAEKEIAKRDCKTEDEKFQVAKDVTLEHMKNRNKKPEKQDQGKTTLQVSAEDMAKTYLKNLYRFCKIAGYVIGGTVFGIVIVLITSVLTVRAIIKRITGK